MARETSKYTYGTGVAVDSSGAAFVTGYTEGALPGNVLTGTADFFLASYNALGSF